MGKGTPSISMPKHPKKGKNKRKGNFSGLMLIKIGD